MARRDARGLRYTVLVATLAGCAPGPLAPTAWTTQRGDAIVQGFTVDAPMSEVNVTAGAPSPFAVVGTRVAWIRGPQGLTRVRSFQAVDSAGQAIPVDVRFGRTAIELAADTRGARFPVTIDPVYETADFAYHGETEDDGFGYHVATGDLNGDGYGDVASFSDDGTTATPADNYGRVFVFLGSADGLEPTPAQIVSGWEREGAFGMQLAAVDLDGDGRDDLAVGAENADIDAVTVYRGTADGIDVIPWATLPSLAPEALNAMALANAGDIDGDGFDDLAYGCGVLGDQGTVRVYRGGPDGIDPARFYDLVPAPFGGIKIFGEVVAGVGDVNLDGFDDLAVCRGPAYGAEPALVYFGGPEGPGPEPAVVLEPPYAVTWICGAIVGGDLDGDGWREVVVGTTGQGGNEPVAVYEGGRDGPSPTPTWVFENEAGPGGGYYGSTLAIGDVDRDGFDDLAIGAFLGNVDDTTGAGKVFLHRGTSEGPEAATSQTFAGTLPWGALGRAVALDVDVDGDGYADLVVGESAGGETKEGVLYVFRGYVDADGDGVAAADDCDDDNPNVGLPWDWYVDADGDAYGGTDAITACEPEDGRVAAPGDCDDGDPDVHPGASEACNEIDDDCDGDVDEGACADRSGGCGCDQSSPVSPALLLLLLPAAVRRARRNSTHSQRR